MPKYDIRVPGCKPPVVDPRIAQYDAIFPLGGPVLDSKSWRSMMPPHRWQAPYPFCVSYSFYALIYALNKAYDKREPVISPVHAFFRAGGSRSGSFIDQHAQNGVNEGFVYEEDKVTPSLEKNNLNGYWPATDAAWEALRIYALKVTNEAIAKAGQNKLKSYSVVSVTNIQATIDALDYTPLVLALPIHNNYQDAMNGWTPKDNPLWHAVVCTQRFADGSWEVFDSLKDSAKFDGFRRLPADYPVGFAMAFRDLPDTWKETQKTWLEQQYPNAYNQYGKPRLPLHEEQRLAFKLRALVESYPDAGIRTIAGKYWTVLVNAALYGGFSYTVTGPDGLEYFAWRDKGSDIANCLYHFRRYGVFPLNFDRLRTEQ